MFGGVAKRLKAAAEQLGHLVYETKALTRDKPWRWSNVWFGEVFWASASYRLSRSAYLALGRGWPVVRVALSPAIYLLRPWSGGCEIHYQADIGRGLRVLHPSLGVVISGKTVAGDYLVLVGGNCIGARRPLEHGDIRIGDNVLLGANACVMGPCEIGNDVRIGANALVVSNTPDGAVLVAPVAVPLRSRAVEHAT
jgi:serine acetyltransferase